MNKNDKINRNNISFKDWHWTFYFLNIYIYIYIYIYLERERKREKERDKKREWKEGKETDSIFKDSKDIRGIAQIDSVNKIMQ